jgi:isopenicillin-N epimerase
MEQRLGRVEVVIAVRDGERVDLRELFLLQPDVVYLNHGSLGACPRSVFESYQLWQTELERQPIAFSRRLGQEIGKAREALATFVGTSPENVVYVTNATMGLNIAIRSLCLAPGDEVLGTDHEYGAMERVWQFNCQKWGARYVRQPISLPVESAGEVVEQIWSGVTDRTKVLFFSHVTSPTALVLPAAELIRRARAAGILTVVDGAHAPGQVPLSLDALGADLYASNCHKWMMSPKGAGFLYARPEVQARLEPLVVSWGWGNPSPSVSRFVDEQQNQGTRDPAAYLSVPAAIQFQAEHDWSRVRAECHELLREARLRIEALTGLPPICPDSPEWYAQMAAFPLPVCDAAALHRRLYEEHRVEVPVVEWNGRRLVRVSMQGYNRLEDVDALVTGLCAELGKTRLD